MLPLNNHAYALLQEHLRTKILCATSGNTNLKAAQLFDEHLDVAMLDPSAYLVSLTNGSTFPDSTASHRKSDQAMAHFFSSIPIGIGAQ